MSIALPFHYALAALVPTHAVGDTGNARDRLAQFLARGDARAALVAQGVDPAEAQARVASLTDAEVQQIAGQLDKLPAAGDGVWVAVAVLLIVLLVVLILKVAGKLR